MRNFVQTAAQTRQIHGRWTMVARVVRNWRQRRDMKRLAALDDYLLRDIGVTRQAIARIAAAPLTTDFAWERDRHHPR